MATNAPAQSSARPGDADNDACHEKRRTRREERDRLTETVRVAVGRMTLPRLRALTKIADALDQLESREATDDVMGIPGIREKLGTARESVAEGQTVPWREVRGDV